MNVTGGVTVLGSAGVSPYIAGQSADGIDQKLTVHCWGTTMPTSNEINSDATRIGRVSLQQQSTHGLHGGAFHYWPSSMHLFGRAHSTGHGRVTMAAKTPIKTIVWSMKI